MCEIKINFVEETGCKVFLSWFAGETERSEVCGKCNQTFRVFCFLVSFFFLCLKLLSSTGMVDEF